MEEILASIRRIISEDDAPPADQSETPPGATAEPGAEAEPEPAAEAAAEPEPEPEPEPAQAAEAPEEEEQEEQEEEEEEALELTDKVETHGDLDVYAPVAAEAPPAPAPAESLVSELPASVAASAFGQLSAAILMPREGRTLEDVVRELLRPLLQQWLDDNLPGIVQQAVEAEVDRIARGRVR